MDKLSRHHPAAFINIIAEDGSKAEAIRFLQETWNDYCELKRENERLGGHIELALENIYHDQIIHARKTLEEALSYKDSDNERS